MTFDSCPKNANQNIGNVIDAYFRKTGLYQIPEWNNEKCVYSDGEGCSDCN